MAWSFLPPHIDLEVAHVELGMPARTPLMKSGVVSLSTGDAAASTAIRLILGPKELQLEFRPNLVIDLPPPLVNIGLGGVAYDLHTGVITPRLWYEDGIGIPAGQGAAEERTRAFMRDLVTSTPLAIPPYDASEDQDFIVTVQQILRNLDSGGASSVDSISLAASLAIQEEIAGEAGGGGFRIPAGSKVSIRVDLAGGPAEVRASPKIRKVEVSSTSFVLRKDGADQADLGRVVLLPGGVLKVEAVRPLGAAEKVAAGESLIRLFGAIAGGGGLDPRRLQPRVVEGLLMKEIEAALRPALTSWVRENAAIASGINLGTALGIAV